MKEDVFGTEALAVREDSERLNAFIKNNSKFIKQCAYKSVHKYVSDSDDEYAVALSAFHEAVRSFDETKGAFSSFAQIVIKRRLLDYIDKEYRHRAEISVEPYMMEGELKAILGITTHSTTIFGADWRKDYLVATSGNIDQHVSTLAAYAQHEMKFLKDFTATFGLRYTHHETFNNHLTPKLSLMYAPGSFRFRATYSAGFRAPGLDELYYHYYAVNRGKPQISFGNQDLKPEDSHYFSLNAEYRTHLIAISLTGYLNRINDMIVKQKINVDDTSLAMLQREFPEMTEAEASKLVSYALYQNSDKGDVKGMQLNISANILPGLNISANYVYTYARYKSGEAWQTLERSIRHAATIAVNYHHSWRQYALNVNLNGRLQSKTYYPDYEDAPGFGIWNLNTTHSLHFLKGVLFKPSLGIDNIFDKVDRRIDASDRKYALYTPGRMFVIGGTIKLWK